LACGNVAVDVILLGESLNLKLDGKANTIVITFVGERTQKLNNITLASNNINPLGFSPTQDTGGVLQSLEHMRKFFSPRDGVVPGR